MHKIISVSIMFANTLYKWRQNHNRRKAKMGKKSQGNMRLSLAAIISISSGQAGDRGGSSKAVLKGGLING